MSVIEACTADEAVDIIANQTTQSWFTDIQMPGKLSGVDLAYAVADRFPEARIVIASSRLTPADIELPSSAEFFAKPHDLHEVLSRLR